MAKIEVATKKEEPKQEVLVPNVLNAGLPAADVKSWPVITAPEEQAVEVLRENLARGFTEFDLDRVSIPSGGGLAWTVPTLEGKVPMQTLSGIIIYFKEPRAYWKTSFDQSGGGSPPDCSSSDGSFGRGEPGGECSKCPLSEFGSAEKTDKTGKPVEARGQACKQMRQLFLLTPDSLIPMVVSAPPTSLKPIRNFMMRMAGKLVFYHSVVVGLSLVENKNKDGIKFSQIEPKIIGTLSKAEHQRVMKIRQAIIGPLQTMDLAAKDYATLNS